ncbi:MAG: MBL fold metallo-hydrolase [Vallitaleaceae bacterium]|jgi:phosphoribosyl 1,2-cyclic phosphodiesterase|nr:MBL fold metallo-hydrolase [Vallitaleaceae bacterium]
MKLCSISSGSSGNCIYVGTDNTHLLIDVGISGKRIEMGLNSIGQTAKKIDGILITHEHSDHIKGLGVMARRYHIPIYSTSDTIHALKKSSSLGEIDSTLYRVIEPNQDFLIGDIVIHPFETSHDAIHPVCYTFAFEGKKISIATDLGNYDDYIKEKLSDSNILFIEANHDVKMLDVGAYPYYLKRRIKSDLGHLSNDSTSKLICELYHEALTHIILGHLSTENNMPDVAYETIKCEIGIQLKEVAKNVNITVALRDQVSAVYHI